MPVADESSFKGRTIPWNGSRIILVLPWLFTGPEQEGKELGKGKDRKSVQDTWVYTLGFGNPSRQSTKHIILPSLEDKNNVVFFLRTLQTVNSLQGSTKTYSAKTSFFVMTL